MFYGGIAFNTLCFLLIANAKEKNDYPELATRSYNFDVLVFTQRWPQTVCFEWKEKSPSHECSLPKERNEWTIHGIWPTQYHAIGPEFCNKSMHFDRNALKPLEEKLEEKWIDIECGRTSASLWQHEWNKHGTCATVIEQLNNEVKYFSKGLDLLSTYDMKNVLAKAYILPGGTYNATSILNAIEQVLGKFGIVICRKDKNTGVSYIFEIRLCFDKVLELIDCNGVSEYPTNCDRFQEVLYPGDDIYQYEVVQQV